MATTAATITSYDTGNKPFKSDISRGKWSSLRDFYAAVFTHSFGIKTFSSLPMYAVSQCGILFMVPFLLGLFLLTIPINFIQSFMGQFSSSGFISVYRIAPLFKGVGYVLLIINLVSICCNVAIGSHALVYFFGSFNPEIPWMNCNNEWNSHNCTVERKFEAYHAQEYLEMWSTVEYFVYAVHQEQIDVESSTLTLSWRLMFCLTIMWIVTTAAVIQGVEFIGKLLRYFCYIIFVCFFLISLRIILIGKIYHILWNFFVPDIGKFHTYFILNLVLPIILIGSGGGTLLTISSYNNFHSDIRLYSWINAIILMNVLLISGITSSIAEQYLLENFHFKSFYHGVSDIYFSFVDLTFLFGHFELPNFWSILFFLMLFLGELSGCIIQMLTIITAIFDEYVLLRTYKEGITIVLSVLLFLLSIPFATNVGNDLIEHLFNASAITLCLLCFLDIMIVVWIYGRQRFQRDVQFLLQGKMYKTWQFMILRFVTPVLTLFVLLLNVFIFTSEFFHFETITRETLIIMISIKILPLTLIFIWIIYKLKISTGSNILKRFKSLCIPTDWYPVDPGDKRRYEDVIGACSENFRDLFTNIHIEDIDCENNGIMH